MMACGGFNASGGYVTSLTSFVDCRVEDLAQGGYLALGADGSPVRLALTGLVTILVALIGYRLALGHRFEIRDGVLTAARIGIVLALATQWQAYQALVYNVVIKGPAELAASLSDTAEDRAEALPARIEAAYQMLEALAHPRPNAAAIVVPNSGGAADTALASPPSTGGALTVEEQKRLSTSSVVLLVTSLGAMLSVRVAAGLLLALGPLFAACLLFDGLRGWFEGWVRGLAAAVFGSVAATAVLALELAVLEPQITEILAGMRSFRLRPGITTEVFASTLLFGIVILATMLLIVRAAAGFRLPAWSPASTHRREWEADPRKPQQSRAPTDAVRHLTTKGRAQEIADSMRLLNGQAKVHERGTSAVRLAITSERDRQSSDRFVPLGRTYRRSQPIVRNAAATRRDERL